jgi:hypothetical protein
MKHLTGSGVSGEKVELAVKKFQEGVPFRKFKNRDTYHF